MWRRAYLSLVLVRLYFALSPSYLHPDENFQGPEVIAGKLVHPIILCDILPHAATFNIYAPAVADKGDRTNLQLPRKTHMGVHSRQSNSKRLSTMARLWLTDVTAEMGVDWKWP